MPSRSKRPQRVPPDWLGLNTVIAQRVRTLRLDRGWSQDELARRIRSQGFPGWTRAVVAAFENGGRRIDPAELVGLAFVLAVPLSELVKTDEPWVGVGAFAATNDTVTRMFEGSSPDELADTARGSRRVSVDIAVVALASRVERRVAELAPKVPRSDLAAAARGELEQRIAERLNVEPVEVAAAAYHLWGRSASEERDDRARERPGAKQHISRDIISEVGRVIRTPRPKGRKR